MKLSNYVTISLIVVLVAIGYFFKLEREANAEARKELSIALAVNQAQEEALAQMQEFKEQQERALAAMADSSAEIAKLRKTVFSSMNKVVATNEDFRKWFVLALDRDAIRLYNEVGHGGIDQSVGK